MSHKPLDYGMEVSLFPAGIQSLLYRKSVTSSPEVIRFPTRIQSHPHGNPDVPAISVRQCRAALKRAWWRMAVAIILIPNNRYIDK